MIEHRLIERVLKLVRNDICRLTESKKVDGVFLDHVVDFIRTYADRTHHGKEEDILFRELAKKNMSPQDKRIMRELVDEHKHARKTVSELVDAKQKYMDGESSALDTIATRLQILVDFYPAHIVKEDKGFFPSTEQYFTEKELDAMLAEFWEFDRKMIHEKYKSLVSNLEKEKQALTCDK